MHALQIIAERKIAEAVQRGELQVKGWENRPLPLEDDHLIPPDLRMAYKILRNSGYVPPELEVRKEIARLEEMIEANQDEHERVRQLKKLDFLLIKLNAMRQRPLNLEEHESYHRKVVEKLSLAEKKVG